MRLVANPGTVLLKASSLWPAYGTLLVDVTIKILEWFQDHRVLRWQDAVLPIALILIPAFRVVQQDSVTRAELGGLPDTYGSKGVLRE